VFEKALFGQYHLPVRVPNQHLPVFAFGLEFGSCNIVNNFRVIRLYISFIHVINLMIRIMLCLLASTNMVWYGVVCPLHIPIVMTMSYS